jgi:oxygen-dependent protoporphyrinogen oxidase
VRHVEGLEKGWRIQLEGGQSIDTDAVCVCLPAYAAAPLLDSIHVGLAKALNDIPHADSLAVYYAFKEKDIGHPHVASGFLVPAVEKRSLTACTFAHRKFAGRAPLGFALLRAYAAGKAATTMLHMADADIEKRMLKDLKELLDIKTNPIFSTVYRYPKGLPQYTIGHLDRLETIRKHVAALPTLAVAGNWKNGVGLPDCIESGERAADHVVMDLCQV